MVPVWLFAWSELFLAWEVSFLVSLVILSLIYTCVGLLCVVSILGFTSSVACSLLMVCSN
jgi:hypothetical protein